MLFQVLCARLEQSGKNEEGRRSIIEAAAGLIIAITPFTDTDVAGSAHGLSEQAKRVLEILCEVVGAQGPDDLVDLKGPDLLSQFTKLFTPSTKPTGVKTVAVESRRKPADWEVVDERSSKFQDALEWERQPGTKHSLYWVLTRLKVSLIHLHATFGLLPIFFLLLHLLLRKRDFLAANIALIIPPVFRLLDDYRISSKVIGVKCVLCVCDRVPHPDLKRMGLGLAFFDVTQKCLHFHELPLLRITYPCLFALIQILEMPQSAESLRRHEELFLPVLKELEFEEKEDFRKVSILFAFERCFRTRS